MDVTDFAQVERRLDRATDAMMSGRIPKPFESFPLDKLEGDPPSGREWFLPGFIPKGEVTLFTGPGGAGKSLASQQLATCLAARKPFLGLDGSAGFYEDHDGVLYATCEDDERELHRRQRNIMAATGTTRRDLADTDGNDRLHLVSLRGKLGTELATFDREGNLEKSETFTRLWDTISETGADLVILDNVAHLFTGNENDRGQVTRFVNLLYSLVRQLGVTVILIGHPNKSGDSYSGSTAWLNAVRSHIAIDYKREADGSILDRDARVLTVGKANYAPTGTELAFRWHNWAFVTEADLPPDTAKEIAEIARANADNDLFLRCLRARNDQQRPVSESPASRTYAPRVFEKMAEAKGVRTARFEAAMERLFRIGRIERGVVCRVNRKDREGLLEKCADLRADPALTGCADLRNVSAPTAPAHTLYTTYIPGAAPEGPPAPDTDDLDWSDGEADDD